MSKPLSFKPSATLAERVMRLRNFQSKDFWAMVFARPLTILLLIPVADRPWVTPDRITWFSVLVKLAGVAGFVIWPSWIGGILAALLVNLGLVLDNMDGTLARYRGSSTYLGYYLDKSVDIVCLGGLFVAVALRVFWETGNYLDLILPLSGFAGASIAAYTKWVGQKVQADAELRVAARDEKLPQLAAKKLNQNPSEPPPSRSLVDWIKFTGRAIKSILLFNEVDIFFFLLLAMVLSTPWLFTRVMCSFYAAGAIVGPATFYFSLRAFLKKNNLK